MLTIAGFDPSSGAGVTADLKTIAAHKCYGIACITALTIQSTKGVERSEAVDSQIIAATLKNVTTDLPPAAIKIGMIGSAAVARELVSFLRKGKFKNVVVDPVLRSSSGHELTDKGALKILQDEIIPLASVVTPNIAEAGMLTGETVTDITSMKLAAARLNALGVRSVVVTGGHLDKPIDLLRTEANKGFDEQTFRAEKVLTNSTHGTGCAFSTAVACHLANGRSIHEAVLLSKAYVTSAIANAYPVGAGKGPIHHLYRMDQERPVTRQHHAEIASEH